MLNYIEMSIVCIGLMRVPKSALNEYVTMMGGIRQSADDSNATKYDGRE